MPAWTMPASVSRRSVDRMPATPQSVVWLLALAIRSNPIRRRSAGTREVLISHDPPDSASGQPSNSERSTAVLEIAEGHVCRPQQFQQAGRAGFEERGERVVHDQVTDGGQGEAVAHVRLTPGG